MARKLSAGLLLYRFHDRSLQVFLVHPGGPYFAHKDDGAWSIPKGEYHESDDPLATAKREFHEETGSEVTGSFRPLLPLAQPNGKIVSAWAVEGNIDAATVKSNTFSLEWPPRSGTMLECPEVDRGAWFDVPTARRKLQRGQQGFLDQLQHLLSLPQLNN